MSAQPGGTLPDAIAAIVLAAGRSARMGAHKLLLPLNGKPLLAWSIAAACDSTARPVIVALGRAADEVAAALPAGPYTIVVNQRFAEGMGTTLARAIASLPPTATGALILLGDQPFMPTAVIDAVLAAARAQPARIVTGAYGQRQGHPVYLPRRVFAELLALRDDAGARTIIAREADSVIRIPVADEDAQFDVDTLADYQQAQEIARRLAQSAENTPS
jgi:molybdenum cofactor cytidylyltransferase